MHLSSSLAFVLLAPWSAQQSASAPPATADATTPRPLFVPELRVLHELVGEAAGDQFGWVGRNAGDCDGDGVADVLLTAPTKALGGPAAGRLYAYSGKSGALLFTHDGAPGDQLGMTTEGVGDVDGDGRDDVIVGAPGAKSGRGRALVLSGKDGRVLHDLEGEERGDAFGRRVGRAGDVDGDGRADLLVGADQCDSFGADAGRAYLYSGKDASLLLSIDGEEQGHKLGTTLCGATQDGVTTIAAGSSGANAGRGRVQLFRWKAGELELVQTLEHDTTGAAFGAMFLSFGGDVDGDGALDLFVSDWSNGAKGPSTGRYYVFSGKDGKRLLELTGERAGDGFGIGTSEIGDVDGDGRADLLIGAWQNADGAPSGGKCYLYSADGRELAAWACTVANETFGFDTTGLGDVDGDGARDFLITNAWSGVKGARSGRAFVVAGTKLAKTTR